MARFAIRFLVIAGALWFGEVDADELWSHQPPRNGKKDPARRGTELVGKNVAVEGIAWGSFEKDGVSTSSCIPRTCMFQGLISTSVDCMGSSFAWKVF
jgi:hypothetical protein